MNDFLQYRHTSIVDGSTVSFGPMRVKHQMALVELDDSVSAGDDSGESFSKLLKSIIFELVDRNESNLYVADYEMLLFKIRAKSYGSDIRFKKKVGNEEHSLVFNAERDITVVGEENLSSVTVPLSDGRSVVVTPPTVTESEAAKKEASGKPRLEDLVALRMSIKKIVNADSSVEEVSRETAKSLFDRVEIRDLELIKREFSRFPVVSASKEYTVGTTKFTVNSGDFSSSFFVL